MKGIEILRKEMKGNDVERMETMRDEWKRSGMIGNERKTIDLLLFAGIEPTGTMFQTINNLLFINRKLYNVSLDFLGDVSVREYGKNGERELGQVL